MKFSITGHYLTIQGKPILSYYTSTLIWELVPDDIKQSESPEIVFLKK